MDQINFQTPSEATASGKPSVKHLECAFYSTEKGCKHSEEKCLYAHYRTGKKAQVPIVTEPGKPAIAGPRAHMYLQQHGLTPLYGPIQNTHRGSSPMQTSPALASGFGHSYGRDTTNRQFKNNDQQFDDQGQWLQSSGPTYQQTPGQSHGQSNVPRQPFNPGHSPGQQHVSRGHQHQSSPLQYQPSMASHSQASPLPFSVPASATGHTTQDARIRTRPKVTASSMNQVKRQLPSASTFFHDTPQTKDSNISDGGVPIDTLRGMVNISISSFNADNIDFRSSFRPEAVSPMSLFAAGDEKPIVSLPRRPSSMAFDSSSSDRSGADRIEALDKVTGQLLSAIQQSEAELTRFNSADLSQLQFGEVKKAQAKLLGIIKALKDARNKAVNDLELSKSGARHLFSSLDRVPE